MSIKKNKLMWLIFTFLTILTSPVIKAGWASGLHTPQEQRNKGYLIVAIGVVLVGFSCFNTVSILENENTKIEDVLKSGIAAALGLFYIKCGHDAIVESDERKISNKLHDYYLEAQTQLALRQYHR